ncbi:MAG TPA: hypothetical protein VEA69_21280 [Tepidisphaeraceae bacterium]|nr:hypothetical protein [Tepidisphaeraceae bacterium]
MPAKRNPEKEAAILADVLLIASLAELRFRMRGDTVGAKVTKMAAADLKKLVPKYLDAIYAPKPTKRAKR